MPWPENLTAVERTDRAAQAIEQMVDNMIALLQVHASNQLIFFTDTLSKQVPRSKAAHAYLSFSYTMLKSELASICTFWDSASSDRNSLPTVSKLVDDADVQAEIRRRLYELQKNNTTFSGDAEFLKALEDAAEADAKRYADNAVRSAATAIRETARVAGSDLYKAVLDFRNIHIAHSLTEAARQAPALAAKYGDEQKLLVARFSQIEGYRCLSLTRASGVVNCQSALVCRAFRACSHAAISSARLCLSGMRRSRH